MEVIAAADSDERGLALLNVVNVLRKVVNYLCNFTGKHPSSETQVYHTTCTGTNTAFLPSEVIMSPMGTEEIDRKVRGICKELELTDDRLRQICRSMNDAINQGLSEKGNQKATVKCFPTYVRDLPNGKEKGKFLALDLGGTNFRVLLITLGDHGFKMDSRIYAVSREIMNGPGTGLFDHIAECLASFVNERQLEEELLPLGFTFSFPCIQEGLTKARLAQWTKGFKCAGVEGNDVVQLLEEAIQRNGNVRIRICAVLNDTTGTLMSCAWKNRNCRIGLIVGTGTNACYTERLDKVELWDGDYEDPQQKNQDEEFNNNSVIINTEWGAFGDDGALDQIRTSYDCNIDEQSINPGRQLYEKMISGMYMGEIVRQVLLKLVKEGLLFNGELSEILDTKGEFYTKYISEIEADKSQGYNNCRNVLEDIGYNNVTDADCANVLYVCQCVSRRAAYLAGAGVAVLLNRIQERKVMVAVDGSVYRFHPFFHDLMMEKISTLINPGIEFDLMLSEDGSGRGAALVAAVASRIAEER